MKVKFCPGCANTLKDKKELGQFVKQCPACGWKFFIVPTSKGYGSGERSWQQIMLELDQIRAQDVDNLLRFEFGKYGGFIQYNDLDHTANSCAPAANNCKTWKEVFECSLQWLRKKM
ncbi:hypothetical protein KC887_00780 [Candidatus Kaiserbacteria bacterium]|nr:hypothetical protein [Candidatus Kaiserbacteria bacterium]